MAIVTLPEVLNFLGDLDYGIPDDTVEKLHLAVEAWVKRECRKDFESTSYKEFYDGDGGDTLFLSHFPIVSISRVAMGRRNVISVRNDYDYSSASVSIVPTGVVLSKDSVVNSTVIFATYTTMTKVIDAINAIGNGWVANLMTMDYANFKSTELLPAFGLNCIQGLDSYLQMVDLPINTFETYPNEGYLYNSGNWTVGNKNIYVEYTSGYAIVPEDIKLAIEILIKHVYQKRMDESFGVTNWSMAGVSQSFDQVGIPLEANRIINSYRDVRF